MTSYTGQSGVGLLLTSSVPLRNPRDVTKEYVSTSDIYMHLLNQANGNIFSLVYPVILTMIHNILLWATLTRSYLVTWIKLVLKAEPGLNVVRNSSNGYTIYIWLIPGGSSTQTSRIHQPQSKFQD
ncbi:hypothetical protein PsorP6_000567 [Peronosclerospora sorghi]|uniref:Uncharacterized protein n=1 Tax=Peronosclerospora sorghi TaxID=230839 RepID=A0ACC0WUK9_9STRA|nr:hypothetical protein PsorP6_000567 [Peronosclerospora sorghi]